MAYLSLNPSPAPLEDTEITASLNFHEEAACASPAPARSSAGRRDLDGHIVVV